MKPPPFDYVKPSTITEAIQLLANNEDAKLLAGGQSLIPMLNLRAMSPDQLIDISGLPELNYIRDAGDSVLIGAGTTHSQVKMSKVLAGYCPLFAKAYEWVAHHTVRNKGTIGGNVVHADPSSEMPAVLLAYEASLTVRSVRGERTLIAEDFFQDIYEVAIEEDEVLTEISVSKRPSDEGCEFLEISTRKGDFAIASVGAIVQFKDSAISHCRIVAIGVGSKAQRLKSAENVLMSEGLDQISKAADAAVAEIDPYSDSQADAEYRKDVVATLVRRAVDSAAKDCRKVRD